MGSHTLARGGGEKKKPCDEVSCYTSGKWVLSSVCTMMLQLSTFLFPRWPNIKGFRKASKGETAVAVQFACPLPTVQSGQSVWLNDKEQTFVKQKHPVLTLYTLLRDWSCVQLTCLNF